jgi:hypothetical protein
MNNKCYTELIKKNLDVVLAFGLGLGLMIWGIVGISNTIPLNNSASAATETISVSATIEESVNLSVSTSSVTLLPSLVDVVGSPHIGSSTNITVTAGTNDQGGYTVNIRSSYGGLCHSGGCSTYKVTSTDEILAAGNDGFGVQATTSDIDVTIDNDFDYWGNEHVGDISSTTAEALATTLGPSLGDQITLKIKAAAATTTPSGTYNDTIQLTCLGST